MNDKNNYFSDEVIIEIVHAIKEILLGLIDRGFSTK